MKIGKSLPYGTGRYAPTQKNDSNTFSIMPGYKDKMPTATKSILNSKVSQTGSAAPSPALGEQTANDAETETSHAATAAASTQTASTQTAGSQTTQTSPAPQEQAQTTSQPASSVNGNAVSFMGTVLNGSPYLRLAGSNIPSLIPGFPIRSTAAAEMISKIDEMLKNMSLEDVKNLIADNYKNGSLQASQNWLRELYNNVLARAAEEEREKWMAFNIKGAEDKYNRTNQMLEDLIDPETGKEYINPETNETYTSAERILLEQENEKLLEDINMAYSIQNPQPAEQEVNNELYALDVGAAFDEYKRIEEILRNVIDPETGKEYINPKTNETYTSAERAELTQKNREYLFLIQEASRLQGLNAYFDLLDAAGFDRAAEYHSVPDNQINDSNLYYHYINGHPKAIEIMEQRYKQQAEDAPLKSFLEGTSRHWLYLTDSEKEIYNYLYQTDGQKAAQLFVQHLDPYLAARRRAWEETAAGIYAEYNPEAATIDNMLSTVQKPFAFIAQQADMFIDGKIDPNAEYNSSIYETNAAKTAVSKLIKEEYGAVGGFIYDAASSLGEYAVAFCASLGNPGIATAIMGTNSASSATLAAIDSGMSSQDAHKLGTVTGIVEILAEKIGIENLFNPTALANGVGKYILKNAAAGAAEESLTSLVTGIGEVLISKDESQWAHYIQDYQADGFSKTEAFLLAFGEALGDALYEGAVGAVAGAGASAIIADVSGGFQTDTQTDANWDVLSFVPPDMQWLDLLQPDAAKSDVHTDTPVDTSAELQPDMQPQGNADTSAQDITSHSEETAVADESVQDNSSDTTEQSEKSALTPEGESILKLLEQARSDGSISQSEFDREKARILSRYAAVKDTAADVSSPALPDADINYSPKAIEEIEQQEGIYLSESAQNELQAAQNAYYSGHMSAEEYAALETRVVEGEILKYAETAKERITNKKGDLVLPDKLDTEIRKLYKQYQKGQISKNEYDTVVGRLYIQHSHRLDLMPEQPEFTAEEQALIDTLKEQKIKFTPQDVLFVTKDQSGQIIWLEKGNPGGGYAHILLRDHDSQIVDATGVSAEQVYEHIRDILTYGVRSPGDKPGRSVLEYNGKEYTAIIGDNGFIVSIWPKKTQEEK